MATTATPTVDPEKSQKTKTRTQPAGETHGASARDQALARLRELQGESPMVPLQVDRPEISQPTHELPAPGGGH